ncbi:MAG: phosphatase PAP2 family protein [Bryobacteraceae bacterium]
MRSSERLIAVFFIYAAIVAAWFFPPWKAWIMAAGVIAALGLLSRRKSLVRDFAPIVFTFAAYREMDWFTPVVRDGHLERAWILWDRRLLDGWHLRAALESGGALLPSYLELCYFLVYAVAPAGIALLLLNRRRERVNTFWLVYLAGTLGAYALFPFFPSEPPWIAFAGADLPNVVTFWRQINLFIVGAVGIHSSVFPSAHVSSAFSAAWGLLATIPERRWIGWLMALYAISVAIATVYGRYHYAVDAAAGAGISVAALAALQLDRKSSASF